MAETKIKRRYTQKDVAEYTIYSDYFDNFLKKSQILNAGAFGDVTSTMPFWDKNNLLAEILEIEGDDKGNAKYVGREGFPSRLTHAKNQLKELEAQFEAHCDLKENQGYERPTEMGDKTFNRKLELEAKIDIYLREIEALKNALANWKEKEQKTANANALQYGCLSIGQIRNGELVLIDNQKVERINKVLILVEPASPYLGMSVIDYRKMSERWCEDIKTKHKDQYEQQQAELKTKGHSTIPTPRGLGLTKVSRESLPKWPKGVKNYLEESEE
jgi:hypothetical protein